jgi:hypothetical protein
MSFNAASPLYEFYFRYKWSQTDFDGLQDALVGLQRDMLGALAGPSLLNGGAVAPSGATRAVTIQPYVAINASGYLNVNNDVVLASVTANASGNPRKDLIVARPLIVDGTMITRPTSPFDSVALTKLQKTEVVVIAGTPAGSPAYPSKGADDVIIAGLNVANGATSFIAGNIDTTVTELISTNTNFSNWVVGKDTHGTAAITGDGSSVRAALTLTGGNGQPALTAAVGDIVATLGLVSAAAGLKAKNSGNGSTTIDGYRTGTYTPTASMSGGGTITYGTRSGNYARIGRLVTFHTVMQIQFGAGVSGNLNLGSIIPYAPLAGAANPAFLCSPNSTSFTGIASAGGDLPGHPFMVELTTGTSGVPFAVIYVSGAPESLNRIALDAWVVNGSILTLTFGGTYLTDAAF